MLLLLVELLLLLVEKVLLLVELTENGITEKRISIVTVLVELTENENRILIVITENG